MKCLLTFAKGASPVPRRLPPSLSVRSLSFCACLNKERGCTKVASGMLMPNRSEAEAMRANTAMGSGVAEGKKTIAIAGVLQWRGCNEGSNEQRLWLFVGACKGVCADELEGVYARFEGVSAKIVDGDWSLLSGSCNVSSMDSVVTLMKDVIDSESAVSCCLDSHGGCSHFYDEGATNKKTAGNDVSTSSTTGGESSTDGDVANVVVVDSIKNLSNSTKDSVATLLPPQIGPNAVVLL